FHPLGADSPFLARLAAAGAVLAPAHPGFGDSPRPDGFETVYDLVQLYRALLDGLPDERVTLVGASFGGWLAAELAAATPRRFDRLVLVDTLGVKLGDRETAEIFDVFNRHPREVRQRAWHDPDRHAPDYDALSDDALTRHARDREALCVYGWEPYLYNPRLAAWLGRIAVPTLVLWGESDGIAAPDYGRAYAACIPGARFETVAAAGHHPEREQPDALAARILDFLGG
ncbi:MAG: alpha/beta fold hydrolase, partial [Alphaproteobacteria bacterium]|nr:alpha/beta fold hydrolase [Alphaproteobacteria bacterium]